MPSSLCLTPVNFSSIKDTSSFPKNNPPPMLEHLELSHNATEATLQEEKVHKIVSSLIVYDSHVVRS